MPAGEHQQQHPAAFPAAASGRPGATGAVYVGSMALGVIQTPEGPVLLHAGYGPDDFTADQARHVVDIVNGDAGPAAEICYEPSGDIIDDHAYGPVATLEILHGEDTWIVISAARHAAPLRPGDDPVAWLARALRATGAPPGSPAFPAAVPSRPPARHQAPARPGPRAAPGHPAATP